MSSENPYFNVVAAVYVKQDQVPAFLGEVEKILGPTREEQGAVRYDFCQSVDNPSRFVVFEHWASEADLGRHLQSDHMKAFFGAVEPYFEKPPEIYNAQLKRLN